MSGLTVDQVMSALGEASGWQFSADRGGMLQRAFTFADFTQAFAFMTQVAQVAEQMDHHPEWFNAYDHVVVDLTTHDAGGISQKDVDLAKQIEEIASKLI